MNNSISIMLIDPIKKNGEVPNLQRSQVPTTPLYIGVDNFPGNDLKATGVFLSGGTFQGPSIFEKDVPSELKANISQQTFSHIITTESEKTSVISNLAEVSGHYGAVSGSGSLSFTNEMSITQTTLNVLKYAFLSIGTKIFNFKDQKLNPQVLELLDPTKPQNKDPKKYLDNISNFLSTYGYYYVDSYELFGELLAFWQIDTISKSNKTDIQNKLSAEFSGGSSDFSATNEFISNISSSFSETKITYRSFGKGVNKNIQTIDQLNDVFNDFQSSVNEKTAIISKIFIKSWSSLDQIAELILQISDPQLRDQVKDLLNGPKLTQDIWNRMLTLRVGMFNLRKRIQLSIDNPYENDFWGFLTPYDTLPINQLNEMVKELNILIDELNAIDGKNYTDSFLNFQSKYDEKWKKLQLDYQKLTQTPTYSFYVQTGYFDGNVTGPLSGYTIIQGAHLSGNLDPSNMQINSIFYSGPTLQRPYFFATAWQQGVMSFKKINQPDKKKSPFIIELECRLAWTAHLNWDAKTDVLYFQSNEQKTMGFAVYDTTLNSIPLRGIIGTALTINN